MNSFNSRGTQRIVSVNYLPVPCHLFWHRTTDIFGLIYFYYYFFNEILFTGKARLLCELDRLPSKMKRVISSSYENFKKIFQTAFCRAVQNVVHLGQTMKRSECDFWR